MPTDKDEIFMRAAIDQARKAGADGEIPIGAVVVCDGRIVGRGHNLTERLCDVTAHAEMMAITAAAAAIGGKYLPKCTLYVTVEPCLMCAGAIGWAQVGRIVAGCADPKRGFSAYCSRQPFHPKARYETGLLADECAALMQSFFKKRRKQA